MRSRLALVFFVPLVVQYKVAAQQTFAINDSAFMLNGRPTVIRYGIKYLSRQDGRKGRIKDYRLYFSTSLFKLEKISPLLHLPDPKNLSFFAIYLSPSLPK